MEIEVILLNPAVSKECKLINYKCLTIRKYIGFYYLQEPTCSEIDSFVIPFRDYIKEKSKSTK